MENQTKFNLDTYYLYSNKYLEARSRSIYKTLPGLKMFLDFMTDFKDMLYNQVHVVFEPVCRVNPEAEKMLRIFCKEVETKYYPEFMQVIKDYSFLLTDDKDEGIYSAKIDNIEDTLYSIMAMRNLKHFAFYIEREKNPSQRIWDKTMEIFEPYYWYAQRMIMKDDIELIRASYFPGAGKTYAGNLTCAFWYGYDSEMSILRITYSDDLAKQFTRQIVGIIQTNQYKKVFPKFNKEEKDLFAVNNAGGFKFTFSNVHNFYATTTGGQSTGKRAKLLMIDDVSKGQEDAYNTDVHNQIVDKYDSNWNSRGDDDKQYQILLGTMWSPYDLLNVIMDRNKKYSSIYESSRFKYTKVNASDERKVTHVFVAVPILDYKTDKSTCPKRYSTEKMRRKRDDYRDKDLFEAVYQQNPVEPASLTFAWSRLNTYDKIPYAKDCPFECKGMIDPPKVGKNFCAFGIFKRFAKMDNSWSDWYLVDAVYQLDTCENLYDLMVSKIIQHHLTELGGELNTNSSMLYVIKKKCAERGYTELKTKDVWTYENKEMKISGARNGMRNCVVYPSQKLFSTRSDVGLGMVHLTTWNINGKNAYDDFPDMVSMFVINFCKGETINSMQVLDRRKISFR